MYDNGQVRLNPNALKKAKIVYNFGLSECIRVKDLQKTYMQLYTFFYTILAFLSAVGLKTSKRLIYNFCIQFWPF